MSLKCGIVGLPNVGKSTLFNALTKAGIQAENYPFCTIEPNVGIVEVPDPRLAALSEVVQPERIVPVAASPRRGATALIRCGKPGIVPCRGVGLQKRARGWLRPGGGEGCDEACGNGVGAPYSCRFRACRRSYRTHRVPRPL